MRNRGFTLLEMSIVIAILAILAGGGMTMFIASLQRQQMQETVDKMLAIQKALHDYRVAFERLPCPADATASTSSQFYGLEAQNQEDCDGTPSANFLNTDGTDQDPKGGMVPVKTLRLPDDFAVDGWGRRIMYFVSADMTLDNAFITVAANDANPRMTINDASGNAKTTLAAYVLLSHGSNGHGAYSRAGGVARINMASANLDEQENCDCSVNVVATGLDGVFVQKDPSQGFLASRNVYDDVLMFGTRSDLRTAAE